jgi:hypothetical protein
MELRVFDKTVQPLGAIDELESLLWHTKYFDVGTFSLLAPITDNNSRLLVEGNLITKHDGKKEVKTADGGVWRRAAQITYVHITKDENGLEQLEAQGYMLSWWLNKRCIYPQIVATGTNQYLINLMVKNNCGSAAGTKRRFPLLTFLAQETIDGVAVEYANEVYAQLGQEVKARAQAGKLGYDILLNERERLFGFYLYKGNDLTATNTEGNTPCIFSRDFDNVNEQEYTASIENCGNFIYVQGAADDDGSNHSGRRGRNGAGFSRGILRRYGHCQKVPAGGNRGNNTAEYLYCNAENERRRRVGKLRQEHKFCKYHKYKFKLKI